MKNTLNLIKIKQAASDLSKINGQERNEFLNCLGVLLWEQRKEIIEANKLDVANAKKQGLSSAFIERLILDERGIEKLKLRLKDISQLDAGLGENIENRKTGDGLILRKIRVSLGVIAVIYESRPEVTIDVAALCIKSGNAAILKGGSEAIETNKTLYRFILSALEKTGLDKKLVYFISDKNRRLINWLLKQNNYVDLVIARGGYGLVKAVQGLSTIPVLAHAAGGARIYIDKSADLQLAEKVIINAKISKPSACNSLDTIVIHKSISMRFLKKLTRQLESLGIKIVKDDWDTEFLGLNLSIKIVKNIEEAVNFINLHSKKHSEGIIATDRKIVDYFTKSIDAAALFINCSTRLHDGYVFGLGSEMGIATGKFHARGPVGLKELTSYKWEVYGNGQTR